MPLSRRSPVLLLLAAALAAVFPASRVVRAQEAVAERGVPVEGGERASKRKSTATVALIRLKGALPDGVGQGGLLADVSPHLHRLVERIDKAAQDTRVKALVLQIDSPALGRARADEIRAAIARVRAAGKPVAAHLVGGSPETYGIALGCDSIAMPSRPAGRASS